MTNLKSHLEDPSRKNAVVNDCCTLIDDEVASKSGLSGIALKAGYKTFKGLKPSLLREAVETLLPEFADALDPLHSEAKQAGQRSEAYLSAHTGRAADALLSITDRRAERVQAGIIKSTYQKLRPAAKKHVEAALPRVGQLIDKHS